MFENLLNPYIPHVLNARDKCADWGDKTYKLWRQIRDLIAEGNEPDVNYSYRATVTTVAAGDPFALNVPLDEMWKVDYYYFKSRTTDALVTINANGQGAFAAIGLGAGSVSDGMEMVLRPGTVLQFVTNGLVVDGVVQYKRYKVDQQGHVRRARSSDGNEGVFSSSGPLHETERDIMDTGVPQLPIPIVGGAADV